MSSPHERSAMQRALTLAASVDHPLGPNPRVGAVIIDSAGTVIGEGFHRGPGTAHAEVEALAAAGVAAAGATAVVTLEPCDHTGRTGPCSEALVAARVRRVVFAQADPNPLAGGGAQTLRDAGIDVESGLLVEESVGLNQEWSVSVGRGRPFVTVKLAATLDGRVAAADGTSRWITGPDARADVHRLRGTVDAVAVGTGTVFADDPELTDRRLSGSTYQPLRVVIGTRKVPSRAKIRAAGTAAEPGFAAIATRDLDEALAALFARGVRHMLVEGGPTLATAFIAAGLVDRLIWYAAPVLLGAGAAAVDDLGIATISEALRWRPAETRVIGSDIRLTLEPEPALDPEPKLEEN